MLTSTGVIDDLVKKLNAELDVPFVPESAEEKAIRWIVEKVAPHVPEWALVAMATVADGVTKEELEKLAEVLVAEINKLVDLPGVPEVVEAKLISFVVNGLLDYALAGNKIPLSE
jgi:hypothetical protein